LAAEAAPHHRPGMIVRLNSQRLLDDLSRLHDSIAASAAADSEGEGETSGNKSGKVCLLAESIEQANEWRRQQLASLQRESEAQLAALDDDDDISTSCSSSMEISTFVTKAVKKTMVGKKKPAMTVENEEAPRSSAPAGAVGRHSKSLVEDSCTSSAAEVEKNEKNKKKKGSRSPSPTKTKKDRQAKKMQMQNDGRMSSPDVVSELIVNPSPTNDGAGDNKTLWHEIGMVDEDTCLRHLRESPDQIRRKYLVLAPRGGKVDDNLTTKDTAAAEEYVYPLHMLCALGAPVACVRACYKAFPEAIQLRTDLLGGPLHFCCAFAAAAAASGATGAGSDITNNNTAQATALVEVARFLVKKDPGAILAENKRGQTPLHFAAATRCAPLVVFLTAREPRAASVLDRGMMCTPLHVACTRLDEPCLEIIEDLTEVHPEAGTTRASDGSWPLWNALDKKADCPNIDAVLKDLIVSNPGAASMQHKTTGETPLHKALRLKHYYRLPAVLKDLIRASPSEALLLPENERGNIPLHVSVECGALLDVIQWLVYRNPAAVDVRNSAGEIPHELAQRLNREEEIIQFLNPFEEVEEEDYTE
jgi:ankyrin repeat protein